MNNSVIVIEDVQVKKCTTTETCDGVRVTMVMYKFPNGVVFVADQKVEYL